MAATITWARWACITSVASGQCQAVAHGPSMSVHGIGPGIMPSATSPPPPTSSVTAVASSPPSPAVTSPTRTPYVLRSSSATARARSGTRPGSATMAITGPSAAAGSAGAPPRPSIRLKNPNMPTPSFC
jgi:hypothetical protein